MKQRHLKVAWDSTVTDGGQRPSQDPVTAKDTEKNEGDLLWRKSILGPLILQFNVRQMCNFIFNFWLSIVCCLSAPVSDVFKI